MPYNRHDYNHRYHYVENTDPYYTPMCGWEKAMATLIGIGIIIVVFGAAVFSV